MLPLKGRQTNNNVVSNLPVEGLDKSNGLLQHELVVGVCLGEDAVPDEGLDDQDLLLHRGHVAVPVTIHGLVRVTYVTTHLAAPVHQLRHAGHLGRLEGLAIDLIPTGQGGAEVPCTQS